MRFSIVTPTYNRAHLLPRVYKSLCSQTLRDFEWIIVDDGSTDETAVLIARLAQKANFPITVLSQANSGKVVALNRGVAQAKGLFVGILDSDDWYVPDALDRCWHQWQLISEEERPRIVGLTALHNLPDGSIIGSKFPQNVFDSDSIDIRAQCGVTGDKLGFQLRSVLLEFPFPENLGRFVPEGIVWNRIASRYSTRFVNEVWAIKEYQYGGLSNRAYSNLVSSPGPYIMCNRELLSLPRSFPFMFTLRHSAHLVRFALHASETNAFAGVPKLRIALGLLPGIALYVRDMMNTLCSHSLDNRAGAYPLSII